MSQQLNNISPPLPICWGGSAPGAPLCNDCVHAGVEPHYYPGYMAVYSSRMSTQSGARSTLTQSTGTSESYGSHPGSDPSDGSGSSNYLCSSYGTSSNDSSANSYANEKIMPGEALWDYTPSTILDSLGRTPPPMATPPNMSFSNHLAYINGKLLQFASSRSQDDPVEKGPRFPPALSPQKSAKRSAPADFFVPVAGARPSVPDTRAVRPRRTHSKTLREQNQSAPFDATQQEVADQSGFEHEIKRRRLRQQDSNASAHTFAAKEPASLRKARSLVAGSVNEPSRKPVVVNPSRVVAPPIAVPTIWPRDAALSRLRRLLEREAAQREDDKRCRTATQKPSSREFDSEIHFEATNWLFSVQAPPEDVYKPIRRHLQTSIETRFHAVLLFSRYAARLSRARFNPFMLPQGEEGKYDRRFRERAVQEIALGCLAIAAKFHRDFLPPLLPMMAEQFQGLLGDEHLISFDDLELVQNTIMRSFSHILYQPTPQAYLQEFWLACPTLQCIQNGTFDLHRSKLVDQLLSMLEACLLEYEAIDYPMSRLTAAALLEALHLRELHQQCRVHSNGRHWADSPDAAPRVCAACVSADMCNAMQIHQDALAGCREWVITTWIGVTDECE